jgi:CRISPR-associated protein Cas5t
METLWLRVRAPFAAFRGFQAGTYRATNPVMPPSTAFGFVLNLAGIEMRDSLNQPITTIKEELPRLCISIGVVSNPERCSLYQQLHSYPVGSSGKEFANRTKGAKYWIAPIRREILVGYDGIVGVQSEDGNIFERVKQGLRGELEVPCYGFPFAGDNNFLLDRIDIVEGPPEITKWYTRMEPTGSPRKGSCRLTVSINRLDNSKTTSYLYAPTVEGSKEPPRNAWTWTPS